MTHRLLDAHFEGEVRKKKKKEEKRKRGPVTTLPPPIRSFFINSRILMGCTDSPFYGEAVHPISVLPGSVASSFATLYADVRLRITMTQNNDAGTNASSLISQSIWI